MPHSFMHVPRELLVIATGNIGKLRELQELLAGLPFDVVSLDEFGVASPPETGSTFMENALLKARHASTAIRAAVIADDSGLEVDVLGGAPGIHSARYAGVAPDDAANNAKLLATLKATAPGREWSARYRCALVFMADAAAVPLSAEGVWEGRIVENARGTSGFGYDPYFWLPELGKTAAELDPVEKNRRGHRGMALDALRKQLVAHRPSEARR